MHQDPWEPPDGLHPSDRTPDADSSDADSIKPGPIDAGPTDAGAQDGGANPGGEITRIPSPLLNWQVVEIDGEATLIEESEIKEVTGESVSVTPPVQADVTPSGVPSLASAIREQVDDIVLGAMPIRRVVVMPGEIASFEVSIANQGRWSALFEITIEGWIDEAWTPNLPLRVQLEPGARQVVTVEIEPPRHFDCKAGEHALAVSVRAARYPGHWTRLAATMVVERYAALKIGMPQPRELDLSWFVPSATTRVPITNQGNYAAIVHLQGSDRERQCDFTFYTDGSDLDDGMMGTAHLTLQPGQMVAIPVEVRTRQRPILGLTPRMTPFRVVARVDTEPPLRRAADGQLAVAALIGPWQLAIAALLGVVAIFGMGLAGLALLVALRSTAPANSVPPLVSAPVEAAPMVAFVIQMEQPMPTRVPDVPTLAASEQSAPQRTPQALDAPPSIPIVSAEQVTAPGQPTPVGQPQLRPIVVTTPTPPGGAAQRPAAQAGVPASADNANLTYGAMFKQVASAFDLDWRVLAAQAYLESGFDSLALSGQGDMGLMQIRPGTWNEWAPTVDASDPFDSYSNVLVGAAYLNYLRAELSAQGQHQQEWMLVAYNWGPEKVFAHLSGGGTWESLDPQRRQYAEDILRIAASIPPS